MFNFNEWRKKFDKFSLSNEKEAKLIENKLNNQNFFLDSLDKKEKKKSLFSFFKLLASSRCIFKVGL